MPTATFYRLPTPKRARIVQAAYTEFARAPFHDASVSNIIRGAQVAHGSFYQYFQDKADIFDYLLSLQQNHNIAWMREVLAQEHNDFFAAIAIVFDRLIDMLVSGPYAPFYANVFDYLKDQGPEYFTPQPQTGAALYLQDHLDRSQLNEQSDEAVELLIWSVVGMFVQTMTTYYQHPEKLGSVNALKQSVAQQLQWLAAGCLKNGK
ncbi:TetR/AcrR family transcriptional regulator [Lacticaseibacillus porcinae]|uniref:TetR/AcrR family transcriptional regulator n=1 Tax=Lacticaseibacillus porcinae TaxID=1123687 RepID=UPI000F7ACD18|nr:TetR/AcrR family transcriptional regulator [Lacticaseibacillus porcinae]